MAGTFTTRTLTIATGATETMHDLTNACSAFLREAAHGRNGLLNVFTPHATSGLAVIETGAAVTMICWRRFAAFFPRTAGGTATVVQAAEAATCSRLWCHHTPRCPWSMASWSWGPRSPSYW